MYAHSLNLVLCDAAKNSLRAITFFGILRRVYTLFSASVGRWDILKSNCKQFTVKQWSETRWESRLNSVKALRFQLPFIMNALEEVSNDTNDLVAISEALSLLKEISSYEFILSLIIWYDILMETNIVSKSLQNYNMDICVSTKLVFGLLEYLKNYRENGYESAKIKSNELAVLVSTESVFKKCRLRKKRNYLIMKQMMKLLKMKKNILK